MCTAGNVRDVRLPADSCRKQLRWGCGFTIPISAFSSDKNFDLNLCRKQCALPHILISALSDLGCFLWGAATAAAETKERPEEVWGYIHDRTSQSTVDMEEQEVIDNQLFQPRSGCMPSTCVRWGISVCNIYQCIRYFCWHPHKHAPRAFLPKQRVLRTSFLPDLCSLVDSFSPNSSLPVSQMVCGLGY